MKMERLRIPDVEFRERARMLQSTMQGEGLDALLAFSSECEPAYVRYLADYWPSFETAAVFLPAVGEPTLLIGPESRRYAAAHSRIPRILQLADFRESSQPEYPGVKLPQWPDVFREKPIRRLGIAGWHMFPYPIASHVQEGLGKGEIVHADALMRQAMICKSEAEIRCLRESAHITEYAMATVMDAIRPGMTEAQIVGIAIAAMMDKGAEATAYPVWCCSGPNSNQAISRPTHRQIQKSEIVDIQIGARYDGYCTSISRPVVFAPCPDSLRRFLEVGLHAEIMTIDLLRAGVRAGEVARQVHAWIRKQGYGDSILYGPAHGCGQMECEYPFVETSSDLVLKANMTFEADLFLCQPEMGFRWEDAVLVRAGQPAEPLTSYRREIIVL